MFANWLYPNEGGKNFLISSWQQVVSQLRARLLTKVASYCPRDWEIELLSSLLITFQRVDFQVFEKDSPGL